MSPFSTFIHGTHIRCIMRKLRDYRSFKKHIQVKWSFQITSIMPVFDVFRISLHRDFRRNPDNCFHSADDLQPCTPQRPLCSWANMRLQFFVCYLLLLCNYSFCARGYNRMNVPLITRDG